MTQQTFVNESRIESMRKDLNELRQACREQGTPRIQAAIDRAETCFDCLSPNAAAEIASLRSELAKLKGCETKFLESGVGAIASERKRQIEAEGWTPGHDDTHNDGEMAAAAACYAMQVALDSIGRTELHQTVSRTIRELWPWSAYWWKPKDRISDLVRAGALIAAEIDRIDRAALTEGGE